MLYPFCWIVGGPCSCNCKKYVGRAGARPAGMRVWVGSLDALRTGQLDNGQRRTRTARRADTLAGLLRRSPLKVDAFSPPRRAGRQKHRHLAAIVGVFAMESNEVTFLELNGYENVGSGGDGEDQMRRSHQ